MSYFKNVRRFGDSGRCAYFTFLFVFPLGMAILNGLVNEGLSAEVTAGQGLGEGREQAM